MRQFRLPIGIFSIVKSIYTGNRKNHPCKLGESIFSENEQKLLGRIFYSTMLKLFMILLYHDGQ